MGEAEADSVGEANSKEAVLENCKVNFMGGGPSGEAVGCREEFCAACSSLGSS